MIRPEELYPLDPLVTLLTWKSSQHYIIIIVMLVSFMRMPFMLAFHQYKCISAVKVYF